MATRTEERSAEETGEEVTPGEGDRITGDGEAGETPSVGLFDPEPFTLPVPTLDGHKADTISLNFVGMIELDPTDAGDLELMAALRLDQDVSLSVEAAVAGKAFKVRRGENETIATHVVTCRVHTLYRESGEEL